MCGVFGFASPPQHPPHETLTSFGPRQGLEGRFMDSGTVDRAKNGAMRRPGDKNPEPAGGRAAQRLRDFLTGRSPAGKAGEEEAPAEEHGSRSEADEESNRDAPSGESARRRP